MYYRTDTGKYYKLDTALRQKDEWHAVSNE